jgi:hypothetical protein
MGAINLIFLLDILIWMAIYGMASYLRNDSATFSGSFQFAVIEVIQIAVIVRLSSSLAVTVLAQKRGDWPNTAEHILALLLCAWDQRLRDLCRGYLRSFDEASRLRC